MLPLQFFLVLLLQQLQVVLVLLQKLRWLQSLLQRMFPMGQQWLQQQLLLLPQQLVLLRMPQQLEQLLQRFVGIQLRQLGSIHLTQ